MSVNARTFLNVTMVAALCGSICARGETVTAEPDALLEYIEATGSQYIDTGVNAETGLKADRKSTRLNSSHIAVSRMPSSA